MSNNNLGEIFYNFLRAPEAYKNTVYVDSRGIPTAGLGYASETLRERAHK